MPVRAVVLALCTVLLGADISPEPARVAAARERSGAKLARALETAGVPHPRALLLRVFKDERVLELWAAAAPGDPFVHVGDHAICASSGGPGPKARAGDGQVPEGLYRVTTLNPWSRFHLSLRVDYPNAADRARNPGVPVSELGGEIFVHGNCVTIGCVPIGDEAIEEVYLAALETRSRGGEVSVLILPARPGGPRWDGAGEGRPAEERRPVAVALGSLRASRCEPPVPRGQGRGRRQLPDRLTSRAAEPDARPVGHLPRLSQVNPRGVARAESRASSGSDGSRSRTTRR